MTAVSQVPGQARPGQAVAAAADRLLRMRRGEQVELQSGMDLTAVWQEMNELSPGGYRFVSPQAGPVRWRMGSPVTRRSGVDLRPCRRPAR
jgi:hypothetical protein